MSVNWDYVKKMWEKEKEGKWINYGVFEGKGEIVDITKTEFGPTKGVEWQPKWDIPEKVVIAGTITGALYSKRQNPNHPITPDEIKASIEEMCAAGASTVHVHVRDKEGFNVLDPELFHYVIDPNKEKYPEVMFDACTIPLRPGEWESMLKVIDELELEVSPVSPTCTWYGESAFVKPPHLAILKTKELQDRDIKPQIAVCTTADITNCDRWLIKTGVLEKPYYWILLPSVGGVPMPNVETMLGGLMLEVELIRQIDEVQGPPYSQIIVCQAGRPSIYLTAAALIMGLHIRVGMEDTIYKWPHKDDRVTSNPENYKTAVQLAKILGRELATPNEYRELIGLPKK